MLSFSRENVERLRQTYEQQTQTDARCEGDVRAAAILERVVGAAMRNDPYAQEPPPLSAPSS